MKTVKFCGIPRQKDEFRGSISRLNSAAKTQIPRLGAKFRGPQKTVGPSNLPIQSLLEDHSGAAVIHLL